MIPLRRVPLFVALLFSFAATAYAQKFCTVAPPSPFKHNGLIVTSYDQAARRMKTTLEHPRALGDGIYLYASFFYQDPRLGSTPVVDIVFIFASKEPRYRNSHQFSLKADGAAWPFTSAAYYSTEKGSRGMTVEKTKMTLTYASLQNLIRARRVTARLGLTEFELTHNHLEALREMASLMAPPPVRVAKK